MTGHKGRRAITILIAVVLAVGVAGRLFRRTPAARHATRQASPYVHPITPTPPVVNPPPPNCRARDLQGTTAAVRQLRDNAAAAAAGARRPAARSCRAEPATRAMEAQIDMVAQSVSGCVARDAELDGTWNLVQSAVMALQTCADCTGEPAARQKSCARATELLAEAGKSLR